MKIDKKIKRFNEKYVIKLVKRCGVRIPFTKIILFRKVEWVYPLDKESIKELRRLDSNSANRYLMRVANKIHRKTL